MKASERIICALDLDEPAKAWQMVESLAGRISFYKVGMLLYLAGGGEMVRRLTGQGHRVFLDLKFYDVPDTVAAAVRQAATMGVNFLTVHGNKEILQRAGEAAAGTGLKVLGVTVLTSLDQADIRELGFPCSVEELVLRRAQWALEAGCAGVVASPREASLLRQRLGPELLLVTPGIRPAGSDLGTHKRAATPRQALQAGADYLVIGQPITRAADPRAAAKKIIQEIEAFS
ncbi:MAG TPA: orotidine-5'-phosphate decarboxylase [Bacillota bacterium]|jgi:orotidine-5'-phosphate decarboxylase|nr:orotidine-5'-phosphate decarboxylase [Bacillota bacterium]HPZ42267.1 orotidine-5'-phosphate decarboxylase [Bacillota bacterium]HQD53072.1 orotidine-5'-phosphate decarboxylase [Bacillota bacterium]